MESDPPLSPTKKMFKRLSQVVCPAAAEPDFLNEIIIQNDTLREVVVVGYVPINSAPE